MAITQERMLSLIQAINDTLDSIEQLRKTAAMMDDENQTQKFPRAVEMMRDSTTAAEGFALHNSAYGELLQLILNFRVPESVIRTAAKEEEHFLVRKSINIRNRLYSRHSRAREKSHRETLQEETMFVEQAATLNRVFTENLTNEEQDALDAKGLDPNIRSDMLLLDHRKQQRAKERKEREKSKSQPAPIPASEIPQFPDSEVINLNEELDESDPNFEVRNQRLENDKRGPGGLF